MVHDPVMIPASCNGHMRGLTRRDTTARSRANWCEIFGLTGCVRGTCDQARLPPRTLWAGDGEAFNRKEDRRLLTIRISGPYSSGASRGVRGSDLTASMGRMCAYTSFSIGNW